MILMVWGEISALKRVINQKRCSVCCVSSLSLTFPAAIRLCRLTESWRWIQVSEGERKTMSVETLQMDIDQRGKKLMEFHWPMANCTVLHAQINVPSPSFLHSPPSGGLFKRSGLFSSGSGGGGGGGSTWKTLTDVWDTARLLTIVGKCVWSARLKDGEPRFSAAAVYSSCDFRGNVRNREIVWCGRSFAGCCICFPSQWETFRILAVEGPPLCSVTEVSGWKHLIESLWLILNITRTSVPGQNPPDVQPAEQRRRRRFMSAVEGNVWVRPEAAEEFHESDVCLFNEFIFYLILCFFSKYRTTRTQERLLMHVEKVAVGLLRNSSIQKPVPIPPSFWTYSGTARAPRQVWPRRTGTQLQVQPIHELHQQNNHTIGWLLSSQSRNSSRNSAYYYISNCCP